MENPTRNVKKAQEINTMKFSKKFSLRNISFQLDISSENEKAKYLIFFPFTICELTTICYGKKAFNIKNIKYHINATYFQ